MFSLVTIMLLSPATRIPPDTIPYLTQEIVYSSAGVSLHASLLVPAGNTPRAAVVILHGSGSSDRSNPWTSAYATALARRGVMVLYPDKRGSGASGGSWKTASIGDLAADASAALQLLRHRPDVDTTRLGVIGFSQGGYVAAVLAAREPLCSFAISVSGGTASMLQQTVDEIETDAAADGIKFNDQDRRNVMTLHEIAFARASGRYSWDQYRHRVDSIVHASPQLVPVVGTFPVDSLDSIWTWLGRVATFDPMQYWTAVTRPTLFIFGGKDARVRVDESIARLTSSTAPISTSAVIMRFQGNAHALYRDDELDFIARWIADRGVN